MDSWKESIEAWLLDCSGATAINGASHLVNGDSNLVENEELTDALTQQQKEQLTAACNMQNDKLFRALFTLFEEKSRNLDLYDKVLKQMFVLARCEVSQVRQFALQFSPALIYLDLHALAHSDSKSVFSIELVLLALYNAEVLDDAGQYRIPSYRVPTLARPSCYHDPSSLGQPSFTPDSLVRLENLDRTLPPLPPVSPLMYASKGQNGGKRQDTHTAITDGSSAVNGNSQQLPNFHLATITASTRSAVLSCVMAAFNAVIISLQPIVLVFLCKFTSRLVTQGLPKGNSHQKRSSYSESSSVGGVSRGINTRYSVQADLLLQLLLAAYSAVHNLRGEESSGCGDVTTSSPSQFVAHKNTHKRHKLSNAECMCVAVQAIEDIQMRSECDLLPELLHLSYGITHSLKHNNIINGEASDSPSLSSAVPPPPSTPLSKTFITNASFRTKKLPEDIPVQLDSSRPTQSASDSSSSSKVLVSISEEENEGELKRDAKENISGRSLASIAGEKTSSKFTPTKFSPSNLAIPGLKRKEKDKNKSTLDKKDSQGDLKKRNGKEEEERSKSGKEHEQIQQLMEMKIIGGNKSEKSKSADEAESSSLSGSLSSVEATDKM